MRPEKYNFQWFEKEDRRKSFCASVSLDGKLHLGKSLRESLPPSILVGLDSNAMTLTIADGHGAGIDWPACGVFTPHGLAAQLTAIGLPPPISFRMTRDEHTGYLLGKIILRRKADSNGKLHFDTEQLLARFRPILEDTVRLMSKSMPLADRKSSAAEALCAVAQDYQPGYGDLETYLEHRVKLALHAENRQYVESYTQRSLDQPFSSDHDHEDGLCLYDTIADVGSDWMKTLDDCLNAERFYSQLTSNQQELIQMLQDGFKISEISDILNVSERDIRRMACEMIQQRQKFDGEI